MASLEDLVAVRSQTALFVRRYLRAVEAIELPGWGFATSREWFTSSYQWPDVVVAGGHAKDFEREKRQFSAAGCSPSARPARTAWFGGHDPTAGGWERWREHRRLLVVGGPGTGKTALSRMTARLLAMVALKKWEAQQDSLRNFPLPIWASLDAAVAARAVRPVLESTLGTSLAYGAGDGGGEQRGAVEASSKFLMEGLGRRTTTLFLDEEIPGAAARIAEIADLSGLECQVIVTARHRPDPWSGGRPFITYELQSLTTEQQKAFISTSIDDKQRADVIWLRLAARPTEATPFHLALLCKSAGEETVLDDVHLIDGYVRHLVADPAKASALLVSDRYRVLREAAATMFERSAQAVFLSDDWNMALRRACKTCGVDEPGRFRKALHERLIDSGLLVEEAPRNLRFVHLQVYDFLAAVGGLVDANRLRAFTRSLRCLFLGERGAQIRKWAADYHCGILKERGLTIWIPWIGLRQFSRRTTRLTALGVAAVLFTTWGVLNRFNDGRNTLGSEVVTQDAVEVTQAPTHRPSGGPPEEPMAGTANGPNISNGCVVVYAFTIDTWYIQPKAGPDACVPVQPDGSWETTTNGGTRYIALLIETGSVNLPSRLSRPPDELPGVIAAAKVEGR